jgi:hypothetical protein
MMFVVMTDALASAEAGAQAISLFQPEPFSLS